MMKSHLFTAILLCLTIALFSFINPIKKTLVKGAKAESTLINTDSTESRNTISTEAATLYNDLQLSSKHLSQEAFEFALKGYEKLKASGSVTNDKYLTIVDFSQSSRSRRFYLIDMQDKKVVLNTFVSHGKNSGVDMAEHFSNNPNSNQSSLGFYVTKNTYTGKHGMSLRISGQEKGFNDNAEARGVVVHGAEYVNFGRVNSDYMGRSQGCPALPENEYAEVINLIKDGSVMFLYSPQDTYVHNSELIN